MSANTIGPRVLGKGSQLRVKILWWGDFQFLDRIEKMHISLFLLLWVQLTSLGTKCKRKEDSERWRREGRPLRDSATQGKKMSSVSSCSMLLLASRIRDSMPERPAIQKQQQAKTGKSPYEKPTFSSQRMRRGEDRNFYTITTLLQHNSTEKTVAPSWSAKVEWGT